MPCPCPAHAQPSLPQSMPCPYPAHALPMPSPRSPSRYPQPNRKPWAFVLARCAAMLSADGEAGEGLLVRSASPLLPLGLTQLPTSLLLQNERHRQVAAGLKKVLANTKSNARNKENGKGRQANAKSNAKVKEETRARRAEQQALGGVPV